MRAALCGWVLLVLLASPSVTKAFNYGMADQICLGDRIVPPSFGKRAPIPIGCELVDCCPGCPGPGPLEWRIKVDAKILTGAELRFEGLADSEIKRLKIDGAAKLDGERIVLRPGNSRIRGLPYRAGTPVAVGLLQPMARKESARGLPARYSGGVVEHISVQQFLGPFPVNNFDWHFFIKPCFRPVKPPPPHFDRLRIQGIAAGDDVVVMMDARTQTQCRDGVGEPEWVFRSTGVTLFGNLLSPTTTCNSEIAIFSKKHAMKWEPAVPWTDNLGDVHTVTLDPLIDVPVHIWVVDDATAAIAQQHIEKARDLYLENMVGVRFVPNIRKLSDVSTDPNAFQIVKNGIDAWGSECLALDPIKATAFYTPKTLNVYYVDRGFTGKNCAIKPTPGVCSTNTTTYPPGDANMTYLGTIATPTTLAHEIGHAYGLRPAKCNGHTEGVPGFGAGNIMWTGSSVERVSFTPGQVFRMNTHTDVWGGTMLIPNNIPARIPRPCMPNAPVSDVCPALNLQWP